MTDSKYSNEALRQELAAIEHRRWADWMEYMLDCAVKFGDDSINIRTCGWPTAQFEHWQRQIDTDYEDLSGKEKASDLEQVDRYWPLIVELLEQTRTNTIEAAIAALPEKLVPDKINPQPLYAYERGLNRSIDEATANLKALIGGDNYGGLEI